MSDTPTLDTSTPGSGTAADDIDLSDLVTPVVVHDEPAPAKRGKRAFLWRWFKRFFILGVILAVAALIFAAIYYVRATDDMPTLEAVQDYKPAVMTRVHAGDGKVIAEYSKEARVYVPASTIPSNLKNAFVAAEDQRFYTHGGWDPIGLTRAAMQAPVRKMRGQRIGGTSTLTQQVAKNFLTGDDYSIRRKVREIAIARRIEEALSKDDILELYLNEIYFGRRSYGVAAASLNYFGKPMEELTLAQMTYLASLPKGPNNYRLDNERGVERAKNRQAYILGRMVEDGYVTKAEADAAKAEPLDWVERLEGQEYLASEYFNEEIRKQVFTQYGEDELYEGGLSIRTSLDTDMQLAARKALRNGLEAYDRRHGYRGAMAAFDSTADWETTLADYSAPRDIGDWHVGIVLSTSAQSAEVGYLVYPEDDGTVAADDESDLIEEVEAERAKGTLALADVQWAGKTLKDGKVGAKPTAMSTLFTAGDIILVEPVNKEGRLGLRQVPEVNGAIMAMDPHTGRVLALVGGYSFQQSQFNRATQAFRQPGSGFKPFVYAAAIENGYTPASQVLDAPFVAERGDANCGLRGARCERYYKPSNYSEGKWYGLSTLRLGLEKSRNAMTVRLANDIGMEKVSSVGERFGIYDNVPSELAWSLGAGETTLFRLANAYSMMINGGKRVTPSLIDRVQDARGETVFRHPEECVQCYQEEWQGQRAPNLPDEREQVIDSVTAYQTTFMMQGVVENGTGRSIAALGRPLGGKTGTTNDYKDGWFMGFSPDLVAGVYVGFDTPETMGREAGGVVAAPIFKAFMGEVLEGEPLVPFRIPEGVSLAPVNRDTGEPSFIGAENYILEAFRPGTEPQVGGSGLGTGTSYGTGGGFSAGGSSGGSGSFGFGFDDPEPAENRFENIDGDGVNDVPETGREPIVVPVRQPAKRQGAERLSREDVRRAGGTLPPLPEGETEAGEDLSPNIEPKDIVEPVPQPDVEPAPEPEKELEDIDDGLY